MEKKELEVVYTPKSENSIFNIYVSISEKGYSETALKFVDELYLFGNSLVLFPIKYPICKKHLLGKRRLRCAIFRKNYIFIYKVLNDELIIFNVINSSRYVY